MDKTLRILILEDNPVDAELIEYELQDAGFTFTRMRVTTEEDFIQGLKTYSPNIILADYELPTYNGALALAEAKSRCPEVPFILVTGRLSEDLAIETLTSGAKDYVMKHRLTRLAPAVRRALAEADEIKARKTVEEQLQQSYKDMEALVRKRTAALEAEIEERKKVEEAWRESEQKYRELVENANSIIIRMDQKGIVTFFNEYAQRFFGYTSDEILGKNVKILLPQTGSNGINLKEMANDILRNPDEFEENVNENIRKNGEHVWVLWKNKAMRDIAGNIIGNLAIGTDITERRRVEMEASADHIRLHMALEAADMVTWEWDICTRSIRYSDNIQNIVRGADVKPYCSLDELMPLIHPKDREKLAQALDQTSKEGTPFECEYRVHMLNGTYRWILGKGKRVLVESGKPVQVLGLSMDITALKQAEEELHKHRERLEIMVRERTAELENKRASLEELNTALKVLLRQREKDKDELEEKVLANVKRLVMPYIQRLKKIPLNSKEADYVNTLESNLMNIISPFSNKLSSKYLNLTPTEIQIADLIKEGKTTKEIAELLNVSPGTIDFHRENIRIKLHLKNKKTNLKSYLLTLS